MINRFLTLLVLLTVLTIPVAEIKAQGGLEVVEPGSINLSQIELSENTEESSSEVKDFVDKGFGFLKNIYTKVTDELELFRQRTLISITEIRAELQTKIEETSNQNESEEGGTVGLGESWQYIKLSALTAAEAIFAKAFIFYGIIIITIILLLSRIF